MSEKPKFPFLKADEQGRANKDRFLAELIKWRKEFVAWLQSFLEEREEETKNKIANSYSFNKKDQIEILARNSFMLINRFRNEVLEALGEK